MISWCLKLSCFGKAEDRRKARDWAHPAQLETHGLSACPFKCWWAPACPAHLDSNHVRIFFPSSTENRNNRGWMEPGGGCLPIYGCVCNLTGEIAFPVCEVLTSWRSCNSLVYCVIAEHVQAAKFSEKTTTGSRIPTGIPAASVHGTPSLPTELNALMVRWSHIRVKTRKWQLKYRERVWGYARLTRTLKSKSLVQRQIFRHIFKFTKHWFSCRNRSLSWGRILKQWIRFFY